MSWIEDPGIDIYKGFNITQLGLDEAWLNVTSLVSNAALWIYELSSDCHKCPYERKGFLNFSEPFRFIVDTKFPMKYRFRTRDAEQYIRESGNDSYKFCDIEQSFGEFGVYNILLSGSPKEPECRVETSLPPVNVYYPLLLAFLFYLVFGSLLFIVRGGAARLQSLFKSSSSGSSKASSSSGTTTIDNNPAGTGGNATTAIITTTPPPPANRRLSSASAQETTSGATPQYGHIYGRTANVPTYTHSPSGTTEVSISTISSTPTATSVTTYENGQRVTSADEGGFIPEPLRPGPPPPIASTKSNYVETGNQQQQTKSSRQRLRSLDTFRGMAIIIMIFVNDGGAGYYFFEHATWDGLYVADLVFPWFLWIMGVCIPVSIKSQVKRGNSRWNILVRIFVRSSKLILLGLILGSTWGPTDIHTMRLPGILQRFGLCYFVSSILVLFCMTVNITKPEASKIRAALQDVQIIWIAWICVLLLVLLHCILTFFLEVPGCPTGYLGPGGLHNYYLEPYRTIPSHCIGGAAGYIDQQIFQPRHLYQWPTAGSRYKSAAYDPEGALGLLTSIFQVWLGVQTGVTMLVYPRASSRLKRWAAWGLVSGALGALLCGAKSTGGWIPLNKNLWSLSFVLVTNCFALFLLSAFYFVIDVKRVWSGSPLFEPGMNSILLYVGHGVAGRMLPWHYRWGPMKTHFSLLVESLWGTSLWAIIAIVLYKRRKFWVI